MQIYGDNLSLSDRVMDYFIALIVGAILLYVLWVVVSSTLITIPTIAQYGIAIVIAAAGALLYLAKRGIRQ
jgi:hypothetical protein